MADEKQLSAAASSNVATGNASNLPRCNFEPLIAKLVQAHFPGTREWLFDEVRSWLRVGNQRLFWVEGAAGTGKSVVSAKLMGTVGVKEHIVAWHFCRHDNAAESATRVIIQSWAAMLSENVAGFMVPEDAKTKALVATSAKDMFEFLITDPLKLVPVPNDGRPLLLLLDALDELPRESLAPVLELIADVFESLPSFVRLFVTSRAEKEIKFRLRRFQPVEIVVDELRNRADVRAYLMYVAREHFKMELTSADLEVSLERQFNLKTGALKDQLSGIQHAIQLSKRVYNDVISPIKHDVAFQSVCAVVDVPNVALEQSERDFEALYNDAKEARDKVMHVFASEWEEFNCIDGGRTVLRKPCKGKAAEWVDNVIDPGLKSSESALRKVTNDYGGDARRIKDLVRLTVECQNSQRMLSALTRMRADDTFDVEMLRNKYATPTLLGYCDFNLSIRVKLDSGRSHICEVQVNLTDMLKAKELAHVYYEKVRSEIPAICNAVGIVAEKERARFESSVLRMLRRSALDVAVEQLEERTGGLFLYATLLARELQLEPGLRDFSKLQSLPNGLSEIYEINFDRMVGQDRVEWPKYKLVVSMIIAAQEPLPKSIVELVLGAEFESVAGSLSVLFPIKDGRFEIMHKSVVDWLKKADHVYSLTKQDADDAHAKLAPVLLRLSHEYGHSHLLDMNYCVSEDSSFTLRQAVFHLCTAGMIREAHQLVTNFEWLLARVATGGVALLISDVEHVNKISSEPLTKLVASTLRLALGALNNDWRSLAGQLVGRLIGHIAKDEVYGLLQQVCQWRGPKEGWWCPIQPTMEPAGGNQVASFVHREPVLAARWSPDGKLICSGSSDSKVRVISVESGECVHTFTGQKDSHVSSVAWSSDNKRVCGGSSDNLLKVWSLESNECEQTFTYGFPVSSISWSHDNKYICACSSSDKQVKVWLLESGECVQTFTAQYNVFSVTWSSDSKEICSGGEKGMMNIWSLESGKCIQTITGIIYTIYVVSWSHDKKYICSGSGDGKVSVWLAETGNCVHIFTGHPELSYVFAVDWSSDSKYFCSGSSDGLVKVWSLEDQKCLQTFIGHVDLIHSVSWSSDNKHICSGSRDRSLRVWSIDSNKQEHAFTPLLYSADTVAWSNDKKHLVSGSEQLVKVWSIESGECIKTFEGHEGFVSSVAWSNDKKHICSGSNDEFVNVWSLESGKCVQTFTHSSPITAVAWSSDNKQICSADSECTIKVWSIESDECVQTFEGDGSLVISVAWSHDNKHICSGSFLNVVSVWSLESGECVQSFTGHTDFVPFVSWSSDNKQIHSGSVDGTMKVWSLESGQCISSTDNWVLFWRVLQQPGVDPVTCDANMRLCRSSSRQTFAWIGDENPGFHVLHAIGGSCAADTDLEFLSQNRAKACKQRAEKESEQKQ